MKLLSFIILFSSFLNAQNDITEYGLKSNLKRLESITYNNVKKINNKFEIIDSTSTKTILIFNENGNVDSTFVTETKNDTIFKYLIINEFNNNLKSGWKSFNEKNEIVEFSKINWLSKKCYEEIVYKENKVLRKTINFLSDNGNLIRKEEFPLVNAEFKLKRILLLVRLKYGPATQMKIFNDKNEIIEIRDYSTLQKDEFNYPKITLMDNGKVLKITKRNYTY